MATGATETTEKTTTTPEGAPAPEAKPGAQAAPPAAPPKTEAKSEPAKEPSNEPRTPRELADDDDELDEKAPYQLTGAALKKRLQRFSKRTLKEHFGTTDPDEIKGKLKKLEKLESDAEEARKAKLSEEEKTKEELAKERARAEKAEMRARELEDQHTVATQERRIGGFASKFIDDDLVDDALERFAKYVMKELTPKEASRLTDGDIEKWFEDLAEKKPKFAKTRPEAKREEPKVEAKKTPINNGNAGAKPGSKRGVSAADFDPARVDPKHPQSYKPSELANFKALGLW